MVKHLYPLEIYSEIIVTLFIIHCQMLNAASGSYHSCMKPDISTYSRRFCGNFVEIVFT